MANRKQERMTSKEFLAMQKSGVGKKRGEMNKWERSFAQNHLTPLKLSGALKDFKYEAIKLRLANAAWYTPDFIAWDSDSTQRPTLYEVKGFIREAALVRIKVAADLYPEFEFVMVYKDKETGMWRFKSFD